MPQPPHTLPTRDRLDEDRFVAAWRDSREPDAAVLSDLVSAAIEARRPLLAARLVGLLEVDPTGEPADISRARRAAGLLLQQTRAVDRIDPVLIEDFMAAWRRSRKVFMDRARRRHRARQGDPRPRRPRRR